MKHYMHLKKRPFQKIWNGEKTIELRLFDEKRRLICIGDQIEFENASYPVQHILTTVKAIHRFDSFEKLYASLPLEQCGYKRSELETASAADTNISYRLKKQRKSEELFHLSSRDIAKLL